MDDLIFERNGSKTLLIVFGGIKMGVGMPVHEFKRTLSQYECDKLFIKDSNQAWYQGGTSDFNNLNELVNHIEKIIEEFNYNKTITLGNSMGGFAAILIGIHLNCTHIIAFSPQTFVDIRSKIANLDFRWPIQTLKANLKGSLYLLNLGHFLCQNLPNRSSIRVFYPENHKLDRKHAMKLFGYQNVALKSINCASHSLVKELRDNGQLNSILKDIIT